MALRICLLALSFALLPLVAPAQEGESFAIETRVEPPLGPDSAEVADLARRANARADLIYADKITGDLSSGNRVDALREDAEPELRLPAFGGGGGGVYFAIALFVAALLIWLRFGGAGNLLNRRPVHDPVAAPQLPPEAWAISPEDLAQGPEALIRRLLALPDRGMAAAGLLRHSLLAAAEETRIRLARADTERQAFDRLPRDWRQHNSLKALLKIAELAHYGGRGVSDATLQELADIARAILIPNGRARGPHAG